MAYRTGRIYTKKITFMVLPDMKADVETVAKNRGILMSDWLRAQIEKGLKKK